MSIPEASKGPYHVHDGQLPRTLYRYRSLSSRRQYRNVLNEILNEHVFLAAMESLNDPDEGRLTIQFSKDVGTLFSYFYSITLDQLGHNEALRWAADRTADVRRNAGQLPDSVFELQRREFLKRVRVACFTSQPTNFLMWANYATLCKSIGHAGICIEYKVTDEWRIHPFGAVTYSDEIPVFDPSTRDESALVKPFYMKSPEWAGEQEWRITYVLQGDITDKRATNELCLLRLPGCVESIIFGAQTPSKIQEKIIRDVQETAPHIRFKILSQESGSFNRKIREL